MYYEAALLTYVLDHFFGEFPIKHPVVYVGELIQWFENRFYRDSVLGGLWLVAVVVGAVFSFSLLLVWILVWLPGWLEMILTGLIASTLIAHHMLRQSVLDVAHAKNLDEKRQKISMLVSRDTEKMTEEEVYKAAIETYAENLSDGVIAPLFYLLIFGLPGIMVYKAVNTLDSMVGYKNARYLHFGRFSAKMDDVLNWIPARLSALLILSVRGWKDRKKVWREAKGHESPNAGYPITAMAYALHIKLGGPTSYFGQIKQKPWFGENEKVIKQETVIEAVQAGRMGDKVLFLMLATLVVVRV